MNSEVIDDGVKCAEYVLAVGRYITCRCILAPHDSNTPHKCMCDGSWFGRNGRIIEVVQFPRLD